MKKFLFFSFIFCLFFATNINFVKAENVDLSVFKQDIKFSSDKLIPNEQERAYVLIKNKSELDVKAKVAFFINDEIIDSKQTISLTANGLDEEVFIDFKVPKNDFAFKVVIECPKDSNKKNNVAVKSLVKVFTMTETDKADGTDLNEDRIIKGINKIENLKDNKIQNLRMSVVEKVIENSTMKVKAKGAVFNENTDLLIRIKRKDWNTFYFQPILNIQTKKGIKYLWSFDDGQLSSKRNPVHTFKNSGVHDILLIITDSNGIPMKKEFTIVISFFNLYNWKLWVVLVSLVLIATLLFFIITLEPEKRKDEQDSATDNLSKRIKDFVISKFSFRKINYQEDTKNINTAKDKEKKPQKDQKKKKIILKKRK
jgi:hypothetical protein